MFLKLFCAFLVAGVAVAEVVDQRPCTDLPGFSPSICSVNEVRINPCKDKSACSLKKGHNSSIEFDFTPNFSAPKLLSGLFWASSVGDKPFDDMFRADGCKLTPCPVESGKTQTLSYGLRLSKLLPKGTFEFRWKLWNEEDESQLCCFKTTIKLK